MKTESMNLENVKTMNKVENDDFSPPFYFVFQTNYPFEACVENYPFEACVENYPFESCLENYPFESCVEKIL